MMMMMMMIIIQNVFFVQIADVSERLKKIR